MNLPPATRTVRSAPAGACEGCRTTSRRDPGAEPAVGELHHGVAAVQGFLRGQGPHLGLEVDQLVGGPHDRGRDCGVRAALEPFDVVVPGGHHDFGGGQHRAGTQRRQPVCFPLHQPGGRTAEMVPRLPDPGELFRNVRNDPFGGVGGRRGAEVGDVVEDGPVRLVPDRAHHGRGRVGNGPDEFLVAERQQVLQGASAAGDDDHVHVRAGVQFPQRAR